MEKKSNPHKDYLIQLIHYDDITALPNRVFFNEMFNKAINHAKRYEKKFALVFIDIDQFKLIHHTPSADIALKEITSRFMRLLRPEDVIARIGFDEFIILFNDINQQNTITDFEKKLLYSCQEPIRINDHSISMTCSISISIYPDDALSLENLLKNVDIAMHQAKRKGGNVAEYFNKSLLDDTLCENKMVPLLKNAIQQNEFILYYQPKLNLQTGVLIGVEALIRWDSKELGMMMPNQFIALAATIGQALAIDQWVLETACQTNKTWQADYQAITVAVNLSAEQFQDPDCVNFIAKILMQSGLNPEYLELEISESVLFNQVTHAEEKLKALAALGIKISIDQFGTGYSSISFLKKLPLSSIKIDRSFIRGLPYDSDHVTIVRATIALAHNLGLQVVAEGVETAEQLQFLADYDCDMVQGYYLSRPLTEAKIRLQLEKKNQEVLINT